MVRARALGVAVLLLSYGAVGARQPAVRTSVQLPVPANEVAEAVGIESADRSQLLLAIVRLVFDSPDGQDARDAKLRAALQAAFSQRGPRPVDSVPLPLDPSIWRETLLARQVPDAEIIAAILADRDLALLYHGLAALDDETLGWLGPDRETLVHLRRHAPAFSVFGRSVRVKAGRVLVPGGSAAEPLWSTIVGAEPDRPAAFVQRLFRESDGRLAWFYDTVAHLDAARQRFALAAGAGPNQIDRVRNLMQVFESAAGEWRIPERPFSRPAADPALLLSVVNATTEGRMAGPSARRLWERVFKDDLEGSFEVTFREHLNDGDTEPVDAAWLARRVALAPQAVGQRRLQTLLFAQRMFPDPPADKVDLANALRGFSAFPTMMMTLERLGIRSPSLLGAAARHAAALNTVRTAERRRLALAQFQSALGIVERAARTGGLDAAAAQSLAASLLALEVSGDGGYEGRFADWVGSALLGAVAPADANAEHPAEDALLAAVAGLHPQRTPPPSIEWEGQRYSIDPPRAELRRLRRIRARQLSASAAQAALDARLATLASAGSPAARAEAERALADTLTAILYAVHLGEPDGLAVAATDVSARHEWQTADVLDGTHASSAWRLPREEYGGKGWHVAGSLLGLETALGRLVLRRLDPNDMPAAPMLSMNERQTATLTAALLSPRTLSDSARDEIAAAMRRGRERVDALGPDAAEVDAIAREAGLSEWRREALAWTLAHDRAAAAGHFSLVDLFWLGKPRTPALQAFDGWGAATLPLDGCLCLQMPRPAPWETRAGRPTAGLLATRGADVALLVAETLADLRLPAALAPGVIAYAMQDVIEGARPAYLDDWPAFERAVRRIPRERLVDYVAALAADGPLVALPATAAPH